MKKCKDNENEARFIPLEIKNNDGASIICTSGQATLKGF